MDLPTISDSGNNPPYRQSLVDQVFWLLLTKLNPTLWSLVRTEKNVLNVRVRSDYLFISYMPLKTLQYNNNFGLHTRCRGLTNKNKTCNDVLHVIYFLSGSDSQSETRPPRMSYTSTRLTCARLIYLTNDHKYYIYLYYNMYNQ